MSGKLESQIDLLKSVSEDASGVADQMQNRLEEQSSALAKAGDDLAAHAEDLRAIEAQVRPRPPAILCRRLRRRVPRIRAEGRDADGRREAADIVGEHTARATRQAIESFPRTATASPATSASSLTASNN